MNALLTYDVGEKQKEVKNELLQKGYRKTWTLENRVCYLPDTTLWKESTSSSVAIADIKSVTAKLGVKLTRAVAVDFATCEGIEGDPN